MICLRRSSTVKKFLSFQLSPNVWFKTVAESPTSLSSLSAVTRHDPEHFIKTLNRKCTFIFYFYNINESVGRQPLHLPPSYYFPYMHLASCLYQSINRTEFLNILAKVCTGVGTGNKPQQRSRAANAKNATHWRSLIALT